MQLILLQFYFLLVIYILSVSHIFQYSLFNVILLVVYVPLHVSSVCYVLCNRRVFSRSDESEHCAML